MKSICVYCGSRMGKDPAYKALARQLGQLLGERGLTLVYGGGNVGLMGVLADATLQAGGRVVGVIPKSLLDKEVGHHEVSELIVVGDMHERKLKMATLADAFIAMPGGIGTLEELFETLTWLQLGFHQKPIGLLDCADYFGGLWRFLEHMVAEGFLRQDQLTLLSHSHDPAALLQTFAQFAAPDTDPWYEKSQFA